MSRSQSRTLQVTFNNMNLLLFKDDSFSVTYEDMVVNVACEKCLCCTTCRQECGCAAYQDETEDELVYKILGIDRWDPELLGVQEKREAFVQEEKELNTAKCGISKDMEVQEHESSETDSDGEAEVDEEGEQGEWGGGE